MLAGWTRHKFSERLRSVTFINRFYIICQIDLKEKEGDKLDQVPFKEKFPLNYYNWIN